MNSNDALIPQIANRHQVSEGAVSAALSALQHGGGTMAQFSHPDFGGMAQWSKGAMSMVGDMFNSALKAKLDGMMSDLAAGLDDGTVQGLENRDERPARSSDMASGGRQESLWPSEFGTPSSSGGQNDMRYAFFPETRRLVVDDGSRRIVYDTGTHRISGVSQQQSGPRSLRFQSQDGDVRLDDLTVVE